MSKKTTNAPKLRSWRIDCGDSGSGPVGFVAYVDAKSEADALAILRANLHEDGHEVESGGGFKVIVYFNPANVKLEEIELEDCDENADEEAATP